MCRENWRFKKADFKTQLVKLEAALAELGETLKSVSDESYIEQNRKVLQKASIRHEPIELSPKNLFAN